MSFWEISVGFITRISTFIDPGMNPYSSFNVLPDDVLKTIFQNVDFASLRNCMSSSTRLQKIGKGEVLRRFEEDLHSPVSLGIKKVENAIQFFSLYKIKKVDLRQYTDSVTDDILLQLFQHVPNMTELHLSSFLITDRSISTLPSTVCRISLTFALLVTPKAFEKNTHLQKVIFNGHYFYGKQWAEYISNTNASLECNMCFLPEESRKKMDTICSNPFALSRLVFDLMSSELHNRQVVQAGNVEAILLDPSPDNGAGWIKQVRKFFTNRQI